MSQQVEDHFQRKVAAFLTLRSSENSFIEAQLLGNRRALPRDTTLLQQGEPAENAYVLLSGWAIRTKSLSDGRRQVLGIILPGDLIGAEAHVLAASSATVATLTPCILTEFRAAAIVEMLKKEPRLATSLLWMIAREEAFLGDRLLSVGRQSAFERVGLFFVELYHRLKLVGLVEETSFEYPLTLDILADALGMSMVHASRTMQKLRSAQLVRRVNRRLHILDLETLERKTEFAGLYLGRRLVEGERFLRPKFDDKMRVSRSRM